MTKACDRVVLLDGAMGTVLQKKGLKLREIPESLNIRSPEVIESVHRAYFEAGSDFVQTNTFGANPFKLKDTGYETEQIVDAAVNVARRAASHFTGKGVLLDIGPSGRAMAPVGDAQFDEIYRSVARQVRAGADQCDGVLLETFTDLLEAKASALAVLENCRKPVFLTMSFQEDGRTFFGTSLEAMIMTFEGLGLSGLGLNCSLGPRQIAPLVKTLTERSRLPVIVQPNAGMPQVCDGVTRWDVTPDEFALLMKEYAGWGVAYMGGCCGTGPEFIAKTAAALADVTPPRRKIRPLIGICSASRVELFEKKPTLIGEEINPTGKEDLKRALRGGNMEYLLRLAQRQEEQGAQVLDVNVGLPGTDEPALLTRTVLELQGTVTLPLQLDSSNAEALNAAARHYAGKPLLNSVNGKETSLQSVLPVAKKYGACVVGLTLDERGIPPTARGRFAVARKIVRRATALGIPPENIFIDCLTLTASSQPHMTGEMLRALRWVHEKLEVKTLLGVSNVSYGLPRRALLNHTLLTAALANGLDAAILNVGDGDIRETVAAWRLLSGQDQGAEAYLGFCRACGQEKKDSAALQKSSRPQTAKDGLADAVRYGLKEEARAFVREELARRAPLEIIEKSLIPVLNAMGQLYEAKEIYLPQLITAADAAKAALDVIKSALSHGDGKENDAVKVVLATVYGDVHDIGKNIVKVVIENYNYDVIDLGKDVPPEKVVEAVKTSGARIVGLSALMTTTVASMADTVAALRKSCSGVKIIVGGAVLTPELARRTGADVYAGTALETLRALEKFKEELRL